MVAEHRCLAYATESELRAAVGFLSGGLTLGQQVGYFGWGGDDALRGRLRGLAGLDELIERGAARVMSLDQHFRRDEAPDPVALVAFWSDATDAALDAGFSGLRAVDRHDAVGEARPSTARCSCGANSSSTATGSTIPSPCSAPWTPRSSTTTPWLRSACIHPVDARGVTSPFHLHATEDADFALHGEIDAFAAPLLERVADARAARRRRAGSW